MKNNINSITTDINAICKKYSLNITARMALALLVEYFIVHGEPDNVQDVFTENGIIDPQNVWEATIEIIEYFEKWHMKMLVQHLDYTNTKMSYIKFDMGKGEQAYIDFSMTPYRIRSNIAYGSYDIRLIANTNYPK